MIKKKINDLVSCAVSTTNIIEQNIVKENKDYSQLFLKEILNSLKTTEEKGLIETIGLMKEYIKKSWNNRLYKLIEIEDNLASCADEELYSTYKELLNLHILLSKAFEGISKEILLFEPKNKEENKEEALEEIETLKKTNLEKISSELQSFLNSIKQKNIK